MNHGIESVDTLLTENIALRQRMTALEQERDTLQRILNVAPVYLYIYDLVEKYAVFGNTGLAEILGYSDVAMLQQMEEDLLPQLMHPADLAHFPAHIAQFYSLIDNSVIEFEYRMRHIDGSWRWVRSRDRVFNRAADGTPRQIIGVVQDITLQKQSQEAMYLAQLALDHAGDAIFWVDCTGHFIYVNHAACTSLGYTRDELLRLHISDIDRNVSPARWEAIWSGLQQQPSVTFEGQHWRKDDSTFPVEVTTNYMISDEHAYAYGFARDITERKQAEKQLRLAQFTLDNAVDSIQWIAPDGSLVYVNDTACSMLGYTHEELLSMRIYDVDPFFTEEHMGPVWQNLQEHNMQIFEAVHRHKYGCDIPVEVVSNYVRFEGEEYACTFSRDITERKQAEYERRLAQFTLNQLTDSVHWMDSTGAIVYVNDSICAALGYTREELLQMHVVDLDPSLVMENWDTVWDDIKQNGVVIIERSHRRKDGSTIPMEITVNFMEFEGREYACAVCRDLTERKRAEQERAAMLQQVIDAQRDAIRELSTPIIPITDSAMIMPLIGTIDSSRAQQVLETLLEGVAQHRATVVILDITGVLVVDTQVASALIRAAQAVKLLGAQVVITGIRPDVAQTLVHLGADLSGIVTRGTLQAGIGYALTLSNRQVHMTVRNDRKL